MKFKVVGIEHDGLGNIGLVLVPIGEADVSLLRKGSVLGLDRDSEREKFLEHLKWASEVVNTWPEWQQRLLG